MTNDITAGSNTETQPDPRIYSSNSCRPEPSMAKHGTGQRHSTARPCHVLSLWEDEL